MKMGHHVWHELKGNRSKSFRLKYWAFLYGNIKPDISELANVKHHLGDTYQQYLFYRERVLDESLSEQERSIALGITMHYICDYFTKFHAKKPYNEMGLFQHLMYELKLHGVMIFHFFAGQFPDLEIIQHHSDSFHHDFVKLLQSYHQADESPENDLHHALYGVNLLVSDLIGVQPFESFDSDVHHRAVDEYEEDGLLRRAF
jgi:alkylhydroperoxidase/carboxymuconolactone decarboxylase family protein YurZ